MKPTKRNQISQPDIEHNGWKGVLKAGGIAAFLQLACVMITMIVIFTVGGEPASVEEYFSLFQNDRLIGLLRSDIPSLFTAGLYFLTLFGLYAALRKEHAGSVTLATALGVSGVILWLGSHSLLSMLSLSDQYAATSDEILRTQLLSAGRAIMASDMWHSTGAFFSGIFLLSGTTFISILMLKSNVFNNTTALLGILAHGIDLVHVIISIFAPEVGVWLMIISGTCYPIWFFLVGRRMFQLASSPKNNNVSR